MARRDFDPKTIISPDNDLYVDGNLVVKGNVIQVETTQIINRLDSNLLIINADGNSSIDAQGDRRYAVPKLALKYNKSAERFPDTPGPYGWGTIEYQS